jgi:hypothetical protein
MEEDIDISQILDFNQMLINALNDKRIKEEEMNNIDWRYVDSSEYRNSDIELEQKYSTYSQSELYKKVKKRNDLPHIGSWNSKGTNIHVLKRNLINAELRDKYKKSNFVNH